MWIALPVVLATLALVGEQPPVHPTDPAMSPSMAQESERIEKVDVNKASEAELQTVPGIGPATAKRIVEWRGEHGPFETLDDLLNIRGIGLKSLEKLRPYLSVSDAQPTTDEG